MTIPLNFLEFRSRKVCRGHWCGVYFGASIHAFCEWTGQTSHQPALEACHLSFH